MIAGSDHFLNVPSEATAFFGAVAAFVALLLVFFLYLNKKWCFGAVSGLSCCDEPLAPSQPSTSQRHVPIRQSTLGRAYSLDSPESSSDSEADVARRLQQNASGTQQRFTHAALTHHHAHSYSAARSDSQSPPPSSVTHQVSSPTSPQDLISLVEKGRAGVSSNSSCCSSTTSSVGVPPVDTHHPQMANHSRAIAQDIRETRIDNFGGGASNSSKYHKLATESSVESTDINSNSNQDCIVVLGQESCYDTDVQSTCTSTGGGAGGSSVVGGPCETILGNGNAGGSSGQGEGRELISKCGHLEVALLYDAPMRKMTVHVLQARDIPSRDRGQPTHTQVRLLLLPSKKQKHKTKIRSGDNPQYMESFLLHRINPEDVNSMGLRLRVYGCERMRRERLIGECVVSFSSLDLELETTLWLALEPRATIHHGSAALGMAIMGSRGDLRSLARSDSTGSAQSMQHGGVPELLLGLAYNATTGRLSVEIVKGSHFRNLAMNRAPDTYVKLCLVSSNGQEMARSKTSVRRGQPNPLFKETFIFQVALFQLADVTLMVSVYNRRGMTKRKEMIGWFSLGLNSSGAEQLAHWNDMKDLHAQQLCRWHVLVDS